MGRGNAASRRGGADEVMRIDASELGNLLEAAKAFEDTFVVKELRAAIRRSGDDIVEAMRDEVTKPPPALVGRAHYGTKTYRSKKGKKYKRRVIKSFDDRERAGLPRSRGTRAAIAKSITTNVSVRKGRGASVKITAQASKMPAGQGPMVKAYNTAKVFRHPTIYPDPKKIKTTRDQWRWVYQQGRPYFGAVAFDKAQREAMNKRIRAAMDDALTAMARKL